MTALYERFRPQSLDDVAGQARAVATARRIIDAGAGGKALMIDGPSGSGKTTLARIIAGSVADQWMTWEADASQLTADRLAEIERESHLMGWGKGGRAFIVNECHGLRADQIRRLLVMLEAIPAHVVWVFTTTRDGVDKLFDDQIDAGPLTSRCIPISLTNQGFSPAIAEHIRGKCVEAGIDGFPPERYLALARKCKGNARAIWQAVESGELA